MLYLHQSNRLETLAAVLSELQKLAPLSDAFAQEEIIVQSQGMRRYLNTYLASSLGVAANLNFSLPASLTWRLMRQAMPETPALSPFSPEVMRWRLLDLFNSHLFQTAETFAESRNALNSYLTSGESAAYQLAGQLADIFDQYLVYRPEWIDCWQQGGLLDLGSDEIWQAQLWRYLDDGNQSVPHRVALWEKLLNLLGQIKLPERFFVFGVATMAPMYLQLLQALSVHCDVHIFALNPSSQYWGNVIEAAQILRSDSDIDLNQSGHPLLASLGKQGRDFFDALTESSVSKEYDYFDDRPSEKSTLLHLLQNDIKNLNLPTPHSDGLELLNDGSIRVRSAHSPLRELQILKEELLQILVDHPDWQPHDIAVLTPNIEPYSPYIEAIFGQEQSGNQSLPYSISDVKLSCRQPLFYALEQILNLLESRFEVDNLLPLLDSDIVLNRFELNHHDLPLLHDTIAKLNVHWGLNKEMRGGNDQLFTWQQALDRITLGWMMPSENQSTLWQNISAWPTNPSQFVPLVCFSALIQTLSNIATEWQQPTDTAGWIKRIRTLLSTLILPSDTDQTAYQQLEQALAGWQEEADLAQFEGNLNQSVAIVHLKRFLGSESQAGFLCGGITFCSMVPMRSLPFKVICLLGLNDSEFPRNTKAAAFDLIAKHPQKGDRARRDDDRYLFLESLISAREILYLSYIGRSIRNDEAMAPSSLLNQLVDTIGEMTGERSKNLLDDSQPNSWIKQHPLQAFSHRYFANQAIFSDDLPPLTSFRRDYAEALSTPQTKPVPFIEPTIFDKIENEIAKENESGNSSAEENEETFENKIRINQTKFLAFWRNPVRQWLQRSLGWREPYRDDAWDSSEPFAPDKDTITAKYIAARRNKQEFEQTEQLLQAQSILPSGELANLWQQYFQTAVEQLDNVSISQKMPNEIYELQLGQYVLEGQFDHFYEAGQIFFLPNSPRTGQKIEYRLQHLIMCAVNSKPRETHLISLEKLETLAPISQEEAQKQLKKWLYYYEKGQSIPLPFFPKTSWKAAEALIRNKKSATDAAQSAYNSSSNGKAQKEYTEVALVFGNAPQQPIEQPLFHALITQLLKPLLDATQNKT